MSRTPEVFQQTKVVEKEDLDELSHVNNVRYVQWMEDVAKTHWESRAPNEIKEKYVWMVVRHEIDYKGQAFLNDELLIETFVGDHTHVTSQRHVIVKKIETDKVLIKAKSTWCLLDSETRKPAKINQEMFENFYK